jgi:hypothetical protein
MTVAKSYRKEPILDGDDYNRDNDDNDYGSL